MYGRDILFCVDVCITSHYLRNIIHHLYTTDCTVYSKQVGIFNDQQEYYTYYRTVHVN